MGPAIRDGQAARSRRAAALGIVAILLAAGLAAAYRLPKLAMRPMHLDEAVHAVKLGAILEGGAGEYRYDPVEYHGPTLTFLTLPVCRLRSIARYADLDEVTLRIVPAACGIVIVLLMLGLGDGLGWPAAACAAVLAALSTALVFYSRYYIMEVLLVCFTLAAVVGAWRFIKGGSLAWCLVAGLGAGLAIATKETWLIQAVAMAFALLVNAAWGRWVTGDRLRLRVHAANGRVVAGVVVSLVVAAVFYSSFFTNARGPLDAVLTYMHAVDRAMGGGEQHVSGSLHLHPWHFYLRLLVFHRWPRGPIWTEGLIVGLALVGAVAGFARRGLGRADGKLVRFLAVYGFTLLAAYSAIPYKTPWCVLGPLHAMVLVAGVGAVALVRWTPSWPLKVLVGLLLAAGAAQLGWQAWRADFHWKFYDSPYNPWVYGHTKRDAVRLGQELEKIAAANPGGLDMTIKVFTPDRHDYWPLPWYLRHFNPRRIGYYEDVPGDPDADVIVFTPDVWEQLQPRLKRQYSYTHRGLRPSIVLVVGVREDNWKRYIDRIRAEDVARKGAK